MLAFRISSVVPHEMGLPEIGKIYPESHAGLCQRTPAAPCREFAGTKSLGDKRCVVHAVAPSLVLVV